MWQDYSTYVLFSGGEFFSVGRGRRAGSGGGTMKWGEVEQAGLFPTKEVISVRLAAPCFIGFGTGHPHQGRAAFPTPGFHMPRLAGFYYGTRPTAEHSHLLPPIPHAGRKQLPPWETVFMMLGAERAVLVSPTNRFPHAKVCRVQLRNPAYEKMTELKRNARWTFPTNRCV